MPDTNDKPAQTVTLTIDGQTAVVPRGTNLIEAGKSIGIDIPYYCYHQHLSIAGNCRMCQVEIEGIPKLLIACNTIATEGMKVRTHRTSEAVAEAQRATLEFLLINHPLDCTVCDEAGHCKLQDFYYQYNARGSRFTEEKVHKVKALPVGPEVMLDGERCILCTRCVRFCDEVTRTSELAVFERGDKSVIGVHPGRELTNPLSGTVADLCPVGALTHRRWRFNTRFWYTDEYESICTGCSTGCSAKIAVRDDRIVLVRGRLNSAVNREWMCDEGRYGFDRFQPANRLTHPLIRREWELTAAELEQACGQGAAMLAEGEPHDIALFLSPFLTLEEMWLTLKFYQDAMGGTLESGSCCVQIKRRELSEVERILISPDYAPNARALELLGLPAGTADYREAYETRYHALLAKVRRGAVKRLFLVGDGALRDEDMDQELVQAILAVEKSVVITSRGVLTGDELELKGAGLGAHQLCRVLLPGRTVNEKNGIMVNRDLRLQRLRALLSAPFGTLPDWMLVAKLAEAAVKPVLRPDVVDDRLLFVEMVKGFEPFAGLTLRGIGELGLSWPEFTARRGEASGG